MILLFAVAVGQAVASNYLAQPLLDTIRDVFGVSEAVAGLIVTASQVGYAAGLILLLPLGDLFERRRTVVTLAVDHRGRACGRRGRPLHRVLHRRLRLDRPHVRDGAAPGAVRGHPGAGGRARPRGRQRHERPGHRHPAGAHVLRRGGRGGGLARGVRARRRPHGRPGRRPVHQAPALQAVGRLAVPQAPGVHAGDRARRARAAPPRALRPSLVRRVQHPVDHARVPALGSALRSRTG